MIEYLRIILHIGIFLVFFLGGIAILIMVLMSFINVLVVAPIMIILHKKGISISDKKRDRIYNYVAIASVIIILSLVVLTLLGY